MARSASAPQRLFRTDEAKSQFLAQYEAALRNWPVEYDQLLIPTRFGATYLIASGDKQAPPLFLLPALYQCAPAWRANIAGLSQHHRTYAVDVPGEPNKSERTRPMKSRQDQADWFADMLSGLAISSASIVGNSYGALTALNIASLRPESVTKIVAISPSGPKSLVRLSWRFYFHIGAGAVPGLRSVVGSFRVWARNGIPIDPLDVPWQELVSTAMEQGQIRLPPAVELSRTELQQIATKILLLIGDREVVYGPNPKAILKRTLARLPALRGEVVPGGNHLAAMAQPHFVNERILQFLAQHAGGERATA